MTLPSINVCHFFSIESFLSKKLFETEGLNHFHNEIVNCYAVVAETNAWEHLYDRLGQICDTTIDNCSVIDSGRRYLDEVRKLKAYDSLPN